MGTAKTPRMAEVGELRVGRDPQRDTDPRGKGWKQMSQGRNPGAGRDPVGQSSRVTRTPWGRELVV